MSGEALTSTQEARSSPQTATEDCVRRSARSVPARTPEQFRQLQFHWGNPPPAADPSTRIFTASSGRAQGPPRYTCGARAAQAPGLFLLPNQRRSAVRNVHRDFHAEPEING